MKTTKRIEFFFDIISPYSYFGFVGLTRHRNVWQTPLNLKPFYFAGIVKKTKNPGFPLRVPIKEKYMHNDLLFCAQYWGVPFNLPANYTHMMLNTSSIIPQRILVAAQIRDNTLMEYIAQLLWSEFYEHGNPIFTKDQVYNVLKNQHIKDFEDLLEMSGSVEVSNILRKNTDEALENGCFGAPWMHITDEKGKVLHTVFGSDRLPHISDFLSEEYHGSMRTIEKQ